MGRGSRYSAVREGDETGAIGTAGGGGVSRCPAFRVLGRLAARRPSDEHADGQRVGGRDDAGNRRDAHAARGGQGRQGGGGGVRALFLGRLQLHVCERRHEAAAIDQRQEL